MRRVACALRVVATAQLLALALGVRCRGRASPTDIAEEPPGGEVQAVPLRAAAPLPAALSRGLAFIKVPKAAGTTLACVVRRIGQRHGLAHARDSRWLFDRAQFHEPPTPAVWANHGERSRIAGELARQMPGAFLVTILREPIARCLSQFYHLRVRRRGVQPTEANKLRFLTRDCPSDAQVLYTESAQGSAPAAVVASYDFVATAERFEESLLLLAKKLGIGQVDLLYLSTNVAGTHANATTGRRVAQHPPLSGEPESVQRVAREKLQHGGDVQLHEAADRALDEQAAAYGPSFETDLAEFRRRLAVLAVECRPGGGDCGQACIDSVAAANRWS